MPTLRLTKSAIDALAPDARDVVYWDTEMPGFGVKVTPKGRKVFLVLYRASGIGRLRKYTIGPYGRVTLAQARAEALQVFAAKAQGRDPASEKRERRQRAVGDRVDVALAAFRAKRLSQNKSGAAIGRMLDREVGAVLGARGLRELTPRDISELVDRVMARGTPVAANTVLKWTKTFLRWCVGQGLIAISPADAVSPPAKEVARDRVLTDAELGPLMRAARNLEYPNGPFIQLLAYTAQRRSEVAGMLWSELDLERGLWTIPGHRTKNGRVHVVHLAPEVVGLLAGLPRIGPHVLTRTGRGPINQFAAIKALVDKQCGLESWTFHDLRRTAVSGMAALGVPPHVADKILNHTGGTISGVAAVYQRHEFMAERKAALEAWAVYLSGRTSGGQ